MVFSNIFNFDVSYAFSTPCIGDMNGPIATLNDGWIGILADRAILECEYVLPGDAVAADGHA